MNVKAIIFDKDGTLIDFDAFWVAASVKAIGDVLAQCGADRALLTAILEAFGVRDGVTDLNGVLCKGTYEQMGEIVYRILREGGCELSCDEAVIGSMSDDQKRTYGETQIHFYRLEEEPHES